MAFCALTTKTRFCELCKLSPTIMQLYLIALSESSSAVEFVGMDLTRKTIVSSVPCHSQAIAIAQSIRSECRTSIVTLVIPPLHFHLRLYWPAAKQKPEILEIDAAEIRLLRDSRRNSRFFEQLAPLLRTLDAPISEIATHDNPPSSFRCDLRVAPDEVSQVRKTLSGVMPILSERQLITVVAGDEWGMLEEETDEDPDKDMSDEKPVRRRRRSRSRGSKDLKKLWMKKRLEETVDEETE